MDMVVIIVLIAACFFSVAVNEYSDSVGKDNRFVDCNVCSVDTAEQDVSVLFRVVVFVDARGSCQIKMA